MCAKNSSSSSPGRRPTPEVPAPPGDLPKHFPEKTPLSDDGVEAAKREAASPMKSDAGDDAAVESGAPDNDPERPQLSPEEKSNR